MERVGPSNGSSTYRLDIMENERIKELIDILKGRAQERQNVMETVGRMAAKGTLAVDHFASEALHHAHIAELEFVIEKLQQLLA